MVQRMTRLSSQSVVRWRPLITHNVSFTASCDPIHGHCSVSLLGGIGKPHESLHKECQLHRMGLSSAALDWWGAEGHSLSLYVTIQNPHIQFADSGSHAGTVALSIDALIVTFSLSIFLTNDIFPSSLHLLALRFYSIIHIFFWNSFSYVLSLNTRFSTLELRASSSFCSIIVWTLLYLVVTYPLRHGITNWNKGTPWLCCSSRHNSDVARSHSFDGTSLSLIRGSSHDSFAYTPPPKFY